MGIRIITTEDGSHSLFHEELNETYHSTRGALGESLHVFIKEGLDYFAEKHKPASISILEVGLGTGLNAFLAFKWAAENKVTIHFTSLEPYPVERDIYLNLNYHKTPAEQAMFLQVHNAPWEELTELAPFFFIEKRKSRLEDLMDSNRFDLIFFDAFAPSKQAEVWSQENIKKCFLSLRKNGALTTYCAQGQFKRNLTDAGFDIETLQGAMGKKEMVRAFKN